LRLLYIDQDSPTSSLFLYEHFDSQLTRETVSDLLLGVYNEELYENKKRLIIAEKEHENVNSEIKATARFFLNPLFLFAPENAVIQPVAPKRCRFTTKSYCSFLISINSFQRLGYLFFFSQMKSL